MKHLFMVLAAALLVGFSAPRAVQSQTTVRIAPSADTSLREDFQTTNYGAADRIFVDASPRRHGLMRFSGLPSGTLQSATLVTPFILDPSNASYDIVEIVRPWVEGQATWQRASTATAWGTMGALGTSDRGTAVLATVRGGSSDRRHAFNAAGLAVVQRWMNGGVNNGIMIWSETNPNGWDVPSKEYPTADQRPYLEITYTTSAPPPPPPPPPPPAPTYTCAKNTGFSANMFLTTAHFQVGDVVYAFGENDYCYGMAPRGSGSSFSLTLWGDNEQTAQRDGARPGEPIYLRIVRGSQTLTSTFTLASVSPNNLPLRSTPTYATGALYSVTAINIGATPTPPPSTCPPCPTCPPPTTECPDAAELERLRQQVQNLEDELTDLNDDLVYLTEENRNLRAEKDLLAGQVAGLQATIAGQVVTIQEQQQTITTQENVITSLRSTVAARDAEIATLKQQIAAKDAEIVALKAEVERWKRKRGQIQSILEAP